MTVAQFPQPESVGPREWGEEVLLGLAPEKYSMKLISMKPGAIGGLQKHHLKDEMGVVTKGAAIVWHDPGNKTRVARKVRAGDVFHFPPGAVHQIEAITAFTYIECSTPHFNDRIHCEYEYGIEKESGGLPSTKLEEVELR